MPPHPSSTAMPRLFEALGLAPDQVRAEVLAADPDPTTADGVAFWLPTRQALAETAAGAGRAGPEPVPGGPGARGRHAAPADGVALDPGDELGGLGPVEGSGPVERAQAPPADALRPPAQRRPRVVEWPATLRGARTHVSPLALLAVIAVLVLAAGVFGLRVLRAHAAATPTPVNAADTEAGEGVVGRATPTFGSSGAGTRGTAGTAGTGGTEAGLGGSAPPASAAQVVVDVVGLVRRPGVVRLTPGARVLDAIEHAGGVAPGADIAAINMARIVVDGEQIRVPKPGELATGPSGGAAAGTAAAGTPSAAGALVNLNSADVSALDGLPGVGPVLAQRILDWRAQNGRFSSVDDLGEVSGIGEKLLAQIRPKVTV